MACGARAALGLLRDEPERLERLRANVERFRAGVAAAGLRPIEGESAIVPIVVGETRDAIAISEALLEHGVFAIGFGYPVVPEGTARVRVQLSAAHGDEQIDRAIAAFAGEVKLNRHGLPAGGVHPALAQLEGFHSLNGCYQPE